MWTIWINGAVTILNCRTEPRVGLWNPYMSLLILLSIMWASCIITQSSHPFGEAIRPYSWCPSFPSSSCLSQGGLYIMTVFRVVTSWVPELTGFSDCFVGVCCDMCDCLVVFCCNMCDCWPGVGWDVCGCLLGVYCVMCDCLLRVWCDMCDCLIGVCGDMCEGLT